MLNFLHVEAFLASLSRKLIILGLNKYDVVWLPFLMWQRPIGWFKAAQWANHLKQSALNSQRYQWWSGENLHYFAKHAADV